MLLQNEINMKIYWESGIRIDAKYFTNLTVMQ